MNELISERLDFVNSVINDKKTVDAARLVAVSKTVSADVIKSAYDLGQRCFGENRIDVLVPKVESLPKDIEWHFIGNIQSRKIRTIVQNSSWIHSVDSLSKIEKIDKVCGEEGKKIKFLIQVNVSGEEVKSGFEPSEITEVVRTALKCENAICCGFMTMAPFISDEDELRSVFKGLREVRDSVAKELDISLPELSMGMSNDFGIALEEGATMVRVGSTLFSGF